MTVNNSGSYPTSLKTIDWLYEVGNLMHHGLKSPDLSLSGDETVQILYSSLLGLNWNMTPFKTVTNYHI